MSEQEERADETPPELLAPPKAQVPSPDTTETTAEEVPEEGEAEPRSPRPAPTPPPSPVAGTTEPPAEHTGTILPGPQHEEQCLQHLRLKYPHRYAHRHEPRREEWTGATPFPALDNFLFTGAMMLSLIKSFTQLITFHTVLVTALSVGSTLMCYYLDITTDVPISLLSAAIVFPISFGINYAFQRRERCFITMASLKSSAIALYQCHREWDSEATWQEERRLREAALTAEQELESPDGRGRPETELSVESVRRMRELYIRGIPPSPLEHRMASEVKEDIIRLFKEIRLYLTHKGGLESLFRIYTLFDEIWVKQEDLRKRHEWVRSVISRPAQYHRFMMNDFENLKIIHDFRTASTLRGYGFVFLTLAPILFGPYFAWYSDVHGLWSGIFISLFTSALLLTLYKIQEYVEDPFVRRLAAALLGMVMIYTNMITIIQRGPDAINAEMMLEVSHHMF